MTKEEIQRKHLTPAQKKIILDLQHQADTFEPRKGHEVRTCRILFEMGALKYKKGELPGSCYELVESWQGVDLYPESTSNRGRRPVLEKREQPDPPKPKIVRPPAVYSNKSREERIDEILNS